MRRHYPALRGVAIFLVILHHAIVLGISIPAGWGVETPTRVSEEILSILSMLGWIAVPVFLLISGSFYAYAARGNPPQISLKIVKANLSSLLWPYLVWSLVYYAVEWIGYGKIPTAPGIVKNLLVGYPYNFVLLIVFFIIISPMITRLTYRFGWAWLLILISVYQIFLIIVLDQAQYGLSLPAWTDYLVVPVLARTMADWGIYFPLGMYLALNSQKVIPFLERMKWVFLALALTSFGLAAAHVVGAIKFTGSRHLFPLFFVLFVPVIQRDWIPARRFFESAGKVAYGLYLIHFVLINILLLTFHAIFPWFLEQSLLLYPVLLFLGIFIPLSVINWINKSRIARISPYLFG